MLKVSRVFAVVAVAAAVFVAGVVAGCGSSSSATPPTTTQKITTLPKKTTSLVVQTFPQSLTGNVAFTINRTQGNPNKANGWKRHYIVNLDNMVLHLAGVTGKGNQRKARYTLVSADESFSGFEQITNSKCKTTHIVWGGSTGHKPTGTVELFSPKFDGSVGFVFLVPQKGKTLTRPCTATSGGTPNTVLRTARISGNANLGLQPSKKPDQRMAIGIEIQSSTAGAQSSGGYTINGKLVPAGVGSPVQLCRQTGDTCKPV